MAIQIINDEHLENSYENYLPGISRRQSIIYTSVCAFIVFALLSLPFIKVDISVQTKGIVKTPFEKNQIKSPVQGTIRDLFIRENSQVKPGQLLISLESSKVDRQMDLSKKEYDQMILFMEDIETILQYNTFDDLDTVVLQTPTYQLQLKEFITEKKKVLSQISKISKECTQDKLLYKAKVISRYEYEQKHYELVRLKEELELIQQKRFSQWQEDLDNKQKQIAEVNQRKIQLESENGLNYIKSPVGGTVNELSGISKGQFVEQGQVLGEISPDGKLIVECFVEPHKIGYLKEGLGTKMQVDAFDHHHWGLAEGKIVSVSNDVLLQEGNLFFKVRCSLDKNFLQLNNGRKGFLKKGMTVTTRFQVTRRSLFSLLSDNMEDWVNPYHVQTGKK